MMQRWCSKLRLMAALHSVPKQLHHHHHHPLVSSRLLHTSSNLLHRPSFTHSVVSPNLTPFLDAPRSPLFSYSPLSVSSNFTRPCLQLNQVRHITAAKQRLRKLKSRKPMTPITSKVKKVKMKCYSSFKGRFRIMHDGKIRRWKEGKRHNAFSKSKKSKRRLRQPGIVPAAYAKVMKKLNFCG